MSDPMMPDWLAALIIIYVIVSAFRVVFRKYKEWEYDKEMDFYWESHPRVDWTKTHED